MSIDSRRSQSLIEPACALRLSRPRILEVLFSFRVGGSEVVALELAHQLARGGADVMCTALDGMTGPLRNRCVELGLGVEDLGLPLRSVLGRNGMSLRLTRRLRALRLDAVHFHHFLALNKLGLPARLAGIKRIVVTEHSDSQLRASAVGRLRLRVNWRLAHAITVIHKGLKRYLVDELHIADSRITVIPNGVDLDYWQARDRKEQRAELGLGSEFVLVFVGRVVEVKRVPALIAAFLNALPRLSIPARLIVVGDGSDMAQCQSLLSNHPLAHTVMLAGEKRDIRPYLAAADAFILNSESEGTPRALLEAMAMGLPAICTAVGGVPELLDGRGLLTVPGDSVSVERAIAEIIGNRVLAHDRAEKAKAFILGNYDSRETIRQYRMLLLGAAPVALPDRPTGD